MMSKKLIIRLSLVLVAGCATATPISQDSALETDSQTDIYHDEDTQTGADTDFEETDMEDSDSVADTATDSESEAADSESADSDTADTDAFDSDIVDSETALSDTDTGSDEESYFSTCQQLLDANPGTADGETTLYVNGDPDKPWTAYCAGMDDNPTEYLVLAATGIDVNFSQYTAGIGAPGTDVRTVYQRLRLDPVTLQVDTGNQTFSSSTGSLTHGSDTVTSMPYATAMACDTSTGKGLAVVDLAGTPFHIADTFKSFGSGASGESGFSNGDKRIDIWVLGYCGWLGQTDSQYNPYNNRGCPLQLAYDGD